MHLETVENQLVCNMFTMGDKAGPQLCPYISLTGVLSVRLHLCVSVHINLPLSAQMSLSLVTIPTSLPPNLCVMKMKMIRLTVINI